MDFKNNKLRGKIFLRHSQLETFEQFNSIKHVGMPEKKKFPAQRKSKNWENICNGYPQTNTNTPIENSTKVMDRRFAERIDE